MRGTWIFRKSAESTLSALRAEGHIVAACLYDSHGQVFAEYRRPGVGPEFSMPSEHKAGARFEKDSLLLYQPISLGRENTGAIAIVSDLGVLQALIRQYTEVSVVVIVFSILVTYLVSSRLLRLITEPILHLAQIATRVTEQEDYSPRAIPRGNDEVGTLIVSLNKMLEQIQERDAALVSAKQDLELTVLARTKELQLEVDERMRGEERLSEERKVLRALIDNVPDFMYVKDVNCKFLVANLSVARQMGAKTPEELIGKSDFDYYSRELASKFYEDEQRVIRSGQAEINREETGLDVQGNVSQVMTTQVPLRDKNGRVTGLAGVGRDITHLKKAQEEMQRAREAAEAAGRAKSEFLANMSH